eukprot:4706-Heterococcus_DN1.PRE.2
MTASQGQNCSVVQFSKAGHRAKHSHAAIAMFSCQQHCHCSEAVHDETALGARQSCHLADLRQGARQVLQQRLCIQQGLPVITYSDDNFNTACNKRLSPCSNTEEQLQSHAGAYNIFNACNSVSSDLPVSRPPAVCSSCYSTVQLQLLTVLAHLADCAVFGTCLGTADDSDTAVRTVDMI